MFTLARTQAPLVLLALVACLVGCACTPFFDTEIPDPLVRLDDAANDGGEDVDDSDSADAGDAVDAGDLGDSGDADDAVDTTDTAEDPTAEVDEPALLEPNFCGGERPLIFGGERAELGDACGCEGVLVCNGTELLRCADPGRLNYCGGCRELAAVPGDACGACGDGIFVCDVGDLSCEGAGFGNLCGGCERLDGAPGTACEAAEPSRWACEAADSVECAPLGARNACGGAGELLHAGRESLPGESCATSCGVGRLVCDVTSNALRCDGPPVNACGGCGELRGTVGGTCGCEGLGRWTCDSPLGDVVCSGGETNACGGCDGLVPALDAACASGERRVCVGRDSTQCATTTGARNACGGSASVTLPAQPGTACGDCNSGVYACLAPERVGCVGDRGGEARNACGGCSPLSGRIDDACGVCGVGRSVCAGQESLRCEGNPGEEGRNACGGCGDLADGPGEPCGTCAVWQCAGGSVQCVVDVGDPSCVSSPMTCGSLGCAAQHRTCVEGDGGVTVTCGDCLPGYEERAGACAPVAVECTGDGGCPSLVGEWSACGWADTCATESQRTRTVTQRTCRSGSCVSGTAGVDAESCESRTTDGIACGASRVCASGVCVGTPAAPSGVSASTHQTDRVTVTWSAVSSATGYEIEVDGTGVWTSVGLATGYNDATTPSPTIAACSGSNLTASQGTSTTHVSLSCVGATATVGAFRSYRVRTLNAAGVSAASSSTTGHRAVGALGYQWQRATSSGGGYTNLSGATSATHHDSGAPSDGSVRWYRVVLSATGASTVTTPSVSGHRRTGTGGALGDVCTQTSQCPADAWCPTDTLERRCSPNPIVDDVSFPFQYIPSGTYAMGSPTDEPGRSTQPGGEDLHDVTLTRPYFVQRTELTQAQWRAVVGNNPAYFNRNEGCTTESTCPVEQVNWWEAVVYANRLSSSAGISEPNHCYALGGASGDSQGTGCAGTTSGCYAGAYTHDSVEFRGLDCSGYRLPTEAEWERANRGGTSTAFYNGPITQTAAGLDPNLDAIGWYAYNAGGRTRPVGGKAANAWGLYDMSGNLHEWLWDWYSVAYYGASPPSDPLGPASDANRAARGGDWATDAHHCRAAARDNYIPAIRTRGIGIRLARTSPASSCDELACDEAHRDCVVADGAASCSDCLPGYDETELGCERLRALGNPCTDDAECPDDAWCPTDTSVRRCSPNPTVDDVSFPFHYIPSGTLAMGSPPDELGRVEDGSEDQHDIELTRAYFMQRTEVTQAQWRALVGNNPAFFNRNGGCTTESTCPVDQVSWWEAVAYANLLSSSVGFSEPNHCYALGSASGDALGSGCSGTSTSCASGAYSRSSVTFRGLDCSGYRLPTEAEWERAYRGGTTTAFYNGPIAATDGALDPNLAAIGWYTYNSVAQTRPVGGKAANAWGLYDMSGNVREWVWDWYSGSYYGASPPSDPLGPATGTNRVLRGGGWNNNAQFCRAAYRGNYFAPAGRNHGVGFRLARTAPAAACGNTDTNPSHCGGCDRICSGICDGGICRPRTCSCSFPETWCHPGVGSCRGPEGCCAPWSVGCGFAFDESNHCPISVP